MHNLNLQEINLIAGGNNNEHTEHLAMLSDLVFNSIASSLCVGLPAALILSMRVSISDYFIVGAFSGALITVIGMMTGERVSFLD